MLFFLLLFKLILSGALASAHPYSSKRRAKTLWGGFFFTTDILSLRCRYSCDNHDTKARKTLPIKRMTEI